MFTTAELQKLHEQCPSELESLLAMVELSSADYDFHDFASCRALDDALDKTICAILKRPSFFEGCGNLLSLADISYSFRDTTKEVLKKICTYEMEIKAAATAPRER